MIIEADVKCYYCGHVSGQIVGDADQPFQPKAFHPSPQVNGHSYRPGERLRCYRCGGPIFLDDIKVLRDKRRAASRTRELRMTAATR